MLPVAARLKEFLAGPGKLRSASKVNMEIPRSATILARIERLPPSRYMWRLIFFLSLGAFFEIYDLLMTAYVSPGLILAGIFREGQQGAFGLSDQAAFASATFAGLFIGTLAFGSVADRFGRRAVFTYALLWYAGATLLMGLQNSSEGIFLWRFVAGLGLGVEMITIDAYIAELANRRVRGKAFAFNQGVMFCAVPTVAFLSWALTPRAPFGVEGWRWVVFFPVVGALVVWWIRPSGRTGIAAVVGTTGKTRGSRSGGGTHGGPDRKRSEKELAST
jgi:MFS transporter, putative metabolite:H+ symporter